MLQLDVSFIEKFRKLGVRVDSPDSNALLFRNVPINAASYNKPSTNILIKRPGEGLPFVVFLDEDLRYGGTDRMLARAFQEGRVQSGWRAILIGQGPNPEGAVRGALTALGSEGEEPAYPAGAAGRDRSAGKMVASAGVDLTQKCLETQTPTIGRAEEVDAAASCLLKRSEARTPVIVGDSGVGRSNLLLGIAKRLADVRPEVSLISVDAAELTAGTLFPSERENMLCALFEEIGRSPGTIIAIEGLDIVFTQTSNGHVLLAGAVDRGLAMTGTMSASSASLLSRGPIARRTQLIALAEPDAVQTVEILAACRGPIAAHHSVDIDDCCVRTCAQAARDLSGRMPAKAIDLLDGAASLAALRGSEVLGPDDIYAAALRVRLGG